MGITSRQLNRATLARQLLLEREGADVVDAVRRVVALQVQEPASPYIALWSRLAEFDPSWLDDAFADRALVKATLMRITLHAVAGDEYTVFHQAMLPILRASRLTDRRYTSTGLTADDADAALAHVVDFATQPKTQDEIMAMLTERLGAAAEPRLWWALRTYAPLLHAPTGGSWSFGRDKAFEAGPAVPQRTSNGQALERLIWRYLEGFGPASTRDFAQFSLQRQAEIRPALDAMADRLTMVEGPDGEQLFDIPHGVVPPDDTPAPPRLLAMWDSILLAYRDRSRVIPEEYRAAVIRRNGDVLPTVLVDGYVCGVWRYGDKGIEVRAFRTLSSEAWEGIAHEAESLGGLIATRDPATYRRYARWWMKLPDDGEARTIG
jgi:hypothetical protein